MDAILQLKMGYLKSPEEIILCRVLIAASEKLQLYHKLTDFDVKNSSNAIKEQLKIREWQKPNFDGIDYNDAAKRCGYLQRYATCHAALARYGTLWIFQKMPVSLRHRFLFSKEYLNIVCAGGGPGNDILGFCSAIKSVLTRLKRMDLTVIDVKSGWQDAFEAVMSTALSPDFSYIFEEVSMDYHFTHADLTFEGLHEMRQADVILMVKVLSNVSDLQKRKILQNIFSSMKEGALFFYIDLSVSPVFELCASYPGIFRIIRTTNREIFHLCKFTSFSLIKLISDSSYEICVLQKINFCNIYKEDDVLLTSRGIIEKDEYNVSHELYAKSNEDGKANDNDTCKRKKCKAKARKKKADNKNVPIEKDSKSHENETVNYNYSDFSGYCSEASNDFDDFDQRCRELADYYYEKYRL